jgi:hypothetical protein
MIGSWGSWRKCELALREWGYGGNFGAGIVGLPFSASPPRQIAGYGVIDPRRGAAPTSASIGMHSSNIPCMFEHKPYVFLMAEAITLRSGDKILTIRFGSVATVSNSKRRQVMSNEAARVLAQELAQCGWEPSAAITP